MYTIPEQHVLDLVADAFEVMPQVCAQELCSSLGGRRGGSGLRLGDGGRLVSQMTIAVGVHVGDVLVEVVTRRRNPAVPAYF